MKTPTELTQLFRDRGLEVPRQRQCPFQVLHGNGPHRAAHAVFEPLPEGMPTISSRTVYQTLNDVVALAEIQYFGVRTGAAHFDPAAGAHRHLVCIRCGAMRDVHCELAGPSPRRASMTASPPQASRPSSGACAPSLHEQSAISRMLRESRRTRHV
jgi:Fe2+ or Zn2+ uptake regulation protein